MPRFRASSTLCLLLVAAYAGPAFGQAADDDKPAAPVETSFNTKDGVTIAATYLPSKKGKDAVAVILLHMFEGNRRDMQGLGLHLQKLGHAVIMPDLRGHGDSTTQAGRTMKLEAARMPAGEFGNMVTQDMEEVKRFLVGENNKGNLNIERLCIVGAEMGAAVAVNFTANDWLAPDLAAIKQSKDVKACVLLSAPASFKTLTLAKPLAVPALRDQVSYFFIVGAEDSVNVANARRMTQQLERLRPKPEKIEEKTVFLEDQLKTKLVGTKLLGEASLNVEQLVEQFIGLRLVAPIWPWKDRSFP